MSSTAVASPLLPGREAEARQFAAELLGPRRAESDELQQRLGITRESWYLQPIPGGHLLILVVEAQDIDRTFRELAAATDPFARWFKQQMAALTGGTFDQPPPALPEPILEWTA
jgi:hypothetical protein